MKVHPSAGTTTTTGSHSNHSFDVVFCSDVFVVFAFMCFILNCSFGMTLAIKAEEIKMIPKPPSLATISSVEVWTHLQNLLQLTELNTNYEATRLRARNYIVDVLTSSEKGYGFTGDQVIYHNFDWTDTSVEMKGNQEEVITTTWSGVNILAWTNTSALKEGTKFSVVGVRYDSLGWWTEHHGNTYSCNTNSKNPSKACSRNIQQPIQSQRVKTVNTALELLGSCVLLQLAKEVMIYQQNLKEIVESKSALELLYLWDKKDPSSIETGIYEDTPILFIFFDQESVGRLGSQVWSEYHDIPRLLNNSTILSMTAIDLTGTYKPHEPLGKDSSVAGWNTVVPAFTLTAELLTSLLTPPSERGLLHD